MLAVTAAIFTAKDAADIFVNRYIILWGCPTSLIFDKGLQCTSALSTAINDLLGAKTTPSTSYHPETKGGTEHVNHTMAQTLAVSVNKRQNHWDTAPYIEFACNNSLSQTPSLAPNEVHIGRTPRLPFA